MKLSEQRTIAIRAVKAEAKKNGIKICDIDAQAALAVLDDMAISEPSLMASCWYRKASDNQIKLFVREWRRDCNVAIHDSKHGNG